MLNLIKYYKYIKYESKYIRIITTLKYLIKTFRGVIEKLNNKMRNLKTIKLSHILIKIMRYLGAHIG